ncbi:MAG: hypothetical protein KAJ12_10910, partial [Bacteroidetes bacterium]|nr:hypothetical protein [Bacteroidota bacterium]
MANPFSSLAGWFVLVLILTSQSHSQQVDEHLTALEPLLGKEWVGRLDDIELTKSWVPILNGKGIRETTIAPALDYTDET